MTAIGSDIQLAAQQLKNGNLVAIPTETVYGLAADASSKEALHKLFDAKGRPKSHPVIVHLASPEQLTDWAAHVPEQALQLAERFWPGPLTMIFKKREHVLHEVTGGQDTVAIRVPRHEVALKLLRQFGGGLAAPSANRFGKLSPTRATDVANEFSTEVSYVLDGGTCEVGIESTIIDLSGDQPRVLRPGMLSLTMLNEVAGITVTHADEDEPIIKAPGTLKSHYSPTTPVMLVNSNQIHDVLKTMETNLKKAAVLSFVPKIENGMKPQAAWIVAQPEPESYARNLYGNLRQLDGCGCDWIIVETVPEADEWSGIRDRLKRASFREDNK
jgi:L-threonylcarbamoyladenylate synthase